jgi:methyltransferase (TIGR00027 family)
MRNEEFSRTALATATLRAAHRILDEGTLVVDDPIAIRLLGADAHQKILESKLRYEQPVSLALRSHVVLRSRYTEDRLQEAMARGIRQYILIGAGLDSFALRQPDWAKDLIIIEVDHPATQSAKQARIQSAGIPLPHNLRFVAVDFEQETLHDAMRNNGVDTALPTFFSWLGVTMYLTEAAIDAALKGISAFPIGSELVLTFSEPPPSSNSVESAMGAALSQRVADLGEPFISFFKPPQMEAKLRHAGFTTVEFLSADDANERYFQKTNLLPPRRTGIVAAIR